MNKIGILLILFLFIGVGFFADSEEIVNRIMVVVDDDVITLFDLQKAAAWNGKVYDLMVEKEKEDLAQQLINRLLVFQEINKTGGILLNNDLLSSAVNSMKAGKPSPSFSDDDIIEYAKTQLLIQAFATQRFAPLVKISEEEIREYYNTNYGGGARNDSVQPALPEVYNSIKAVLEQRVINNLLKDWLDKQKLIHKIQFIKPL